MKKILFVLSVVVLLSACGGGTKVSENEIKAGSNQVKENSIKSSNLEVNNSGPSISGENLDEDTKEVLKIIDNVLKE